ncbi:MAG: hypothetical protein JXQ87_03740 [Bacteroidia bacterium]
MRNFLFVLISFLLSVLFSCNPDEDIPTDEGNNNVITGLSIEKENLVAYEVGVLKSTNAFSSSETYFGFLDSNQLKLAYVNDSMLSFITPNLQSGDYEFRIEGFEERIKIQLEKAPEISAPEEVIMDFVGNYESSINELLLNAKRLDSLGFIKDYNQQVDEIQGIKDSIEFSLQEFQNLSDADKLIAAQFIEANREPLDEFNRIMDQVFLDGGFKKGNCDNTEDFGKAACLIKEMTLGLAKMTAPAILGALAGGSLTAGIGAPAGAIIGTLLLDWKVIEGRNRFKAAFAELVNWAMIPIENVIAEVDALKKELDFENGVPKPVRFEFETRTLNQSKDVNSQEFSAFFTMINTFNLFSTKVLRRPGFTLPSEKRGLYTPKNLESIEIIKSNSNVQVKKEIIDGVIHLTFSTNETVDQDFDFILKVDYGNQEIRSHQVTGSVVKPRNFTLQRVSVRGSEITATHETFKTGDEFEAMNGLNHKFLVFEEGVELGLFSYLNKGYSFNDGKPLYLGITTITLIGSNQTIGVNVDLTINNDGFKYIANKTLKCEYYRGGDEPTSTRELKFNDDFTCSVFSNGDSVSTFTWSLVLGENAAEYVHNTEEGLAPRQRAGMILCSGQNFFTRIPNYIDVNADGTFRATGSRGNSAGWEYWLLK